MKNFKKVICIILVLVMSLGPSMHVYAASTEEKYVSDIKIGYGDDGKNALIAAGYKVDANFNANETGRGDSVWIGFKTTSNPLDAITDVAVMNMNGDYSFTGWMDEYEELKQQIADMLFDFIEGVKEFRTNLKKGSPYAEAAYEIMNYFIDEPVSSSGTGENSSYTGKRIGDLLKSEQTTDDQLQNIFLKGNYKLIQIIKQAIALACTEWEDPDNTFVTRLNNNGYFKGDVDVSYNHERELISTAISSLKPYVEEAEANKEGYYKSYSLIKDEYRLSAEEIPEGATEEAIDTLQFENYIKKTCTEEQQYSYVYYEAVINKLKEITVKPEEVSEADGQIISARETLYDIVLKDAEELKETDFETIRLAMTAGQIGVVTTVGLNYLLLCEDAIKDGNFQESFYEAIDTLEEEYDTEILSVYYGVELSVYDDPENTAMTKSANSAVKSGDNSNFGVSSDTTTPIVELPGWTSFWVSVGAGLGTGLGIIFGIGWYSLAKDAAVIQLSTNAGSILAFKVAFFVAIIVAVTCIILYILNKIEKEVEPEDITYTRIPKYIVDVKTVDVAGVGEEKVYYTYTCAKRIDAVDSDNSMLVYGDLNGYNKKNEWVALYYSKNRDLGAPITVSMLSSSTSEARTGYMAIHDFGTSAASNLNRYNSGSSRKELYGFIKTTTFSNEEQQASVFGNGTGIIYLVAAFAVGALASGLAVIGYKKKKYAEAKD